MLERMIAYFADRHLLTNLVFLLVLIGGVFSWQNTSKEEMPAITFDTVRVSVRYPGAPAEDVEYFITKPIEEEVRGLDGVYRIESTSSVGQSSVTVELEQNYPNIDEAVTEIRNAVLDVDFPDEVLDDPSVRVFKTTKKAILDVALIHKDFPILTIEGRRTLQQFALALENKLLSLPQVHSIDRSNYLQEEIQVKVYPDRLLHYQIPFNNVIREIRDNHVRKPAGTLEADQEPKVTLLSELDTPEKLRELVIQGGFEGQVIRLDQIAEVDAGYEKNESVYKVNGYEAVMFNVVKSSSYGILDSLDAVTAAVEEFRKGQTKNTPVELVLLDDESIDVRNRISIISINGALGFVLILISLLTFLNKRSGLWVAMGIPFTLCFAMIYARLIGYTINGTTLAAVIIVMGMVVDDAIVVAENINRMARQGLSQKDAVVKGTSYVLLPIVASIVTTCVAFVPLFFFTGRFGRFIEFIPPVIFAMLGASLLESVFILPGHMHLPLPAFRRKNGSPAPASAKVHWFERVEDRYGAFLAKLLPQKKKVFAVFAGLLVLAFLIARYEMKFVMFPHEETRDITLQGYVPEGYTRYETAQKVKEIEDVFTPYIGREVVGFRTNIARSRRGGAVEDNHFRIVVEIVPKEKRKKSADQLIALFEEKTKGLEGYSKLRFSKSRWGQDSGSAIELIVQLNNNALRHAVVERLAETMRSHPALKSVEIEEGLRVPEFRVSIDREKIKRLSIHPADVSSTLRAALEGTVLYEFSNGEEDVHVRLTTVDAAKSDMESVLSIPVENQSDYLVPLANIVTVEDVVSPNAITRRDLRRTSLVFADIEKKGRMTPLEIAEDFEANVFPDILSEFPTATLTFGGEIQDTRESRRDLQNAVVFVLILVYAILAVLFNSAAKPIIIMLAIPFGVVGVVLAFFVHGKLLFGFYAAIGALGLAGVVINDSIIMISKLDQEFDRSRPFSEAYGQIAGISKTRLRAVLLTTLTTVAGVLPTAYGFCGYDDTLSEMMLALTWGMIFGTAITLVLVPCVYALGKDIRHARWFSGLTLTHETH